MSVWLVLVVAWLAASMPFGIVLGKLMCGRARHLPAPPVEQRPARRAELTSIGR